MTDDRPIYPCNYSRNKRFSGAPEKGDRSRLASEKEDLRIAPRQAVFFDYNRNG